MYRDGNSRIIRRDQRDYIEYLFQYAEPPREKPLPEPYWSSYAKMMYPRVVQQVEAVREIEAIETDTDDDDDSSSNTSSVYIEVSGKGEERVLPLMKEEEPRQRRTLSFALQLYRKCRDMIRVK